MILRKIEKEILQKQKRGEWILPFYDKWCISNIPSTIAELLGSKIEKQSLLSYLPSEFQKLKNVKGLKVILLVIDGFGYDQWLNASKTNPFFKILTGRGTVLPLTTVFPSTTAAAVAAFQTGCGPHHHGILEWFLYLKELDEVILSIRFSPINKEYRDELVKLGVNPRILLEPNIIGKTIYGNLASRKIKTFHFAKDTFAKCAYNSVLFDNGTSMPYKTLGNLTVSLRKHIQNTKGPAYFYVYWGDIDGIAHSYSKKSEEYQAEVSAFSTIFMNEVINKLDKKSAKNTVIFVTADHGHIAVDPSKVFYLNSLRYLKENFAIGPKGRKIEPSGSPRDIFLHINPKKLNLVYEFLKRKLRSRATVLLMEEAVNSGLFGNQGIGKKFLERAGNILILPKGNGLVWYKHIKGKHFNKLGHHGGLTREEMLVPFAMARLSDLI